MFYYSSDNADIFGVAKSPWVFKQISAMFASHLRHKRNCDVNDFTDIVSMRVNIKQFLGQFTFDILNSTHVIDIFNILESD